MKKLLVLLVIVLGLLAAAPFAVGLYLDQQTDEQLAKFKANNQGMMLERIEHNRGWLQTQSRYRVTFPSLPDMPPIESDYLVYHGPLPWPALSNDQVPFKPGQAAIYSSVNMPKAVLEALPGLQALNPISLTGHVDFAGMLLMDCAAETGKLELEDDDGEKLNLAWQPVDCEIKSDMSNGDSSMVMSLPKLTLEGAQGAVELTGLQVDYDVEDPYSGLPITDFDFRVKRVADPGEAGLFALDNLRMAGDSDRKGDKFSFGLTYAWDALNVMGFGVNKAELAISLDDMPAQALLDVQQKQSALMNNPQLMADEEASGAALIDLYTEAAPQLLHGTIFNITTLQAELPQGPFKLSGSARLGDYNPDEVPSPLMLIGLIDAVLDASAAAGIVAMATAMAAEQQLSSMQEQSETPVYETSEQRAEILAMLQKQSEQMLKGFVEEGFISQADGNYATKVAFTAGALTVNGKDFPLFGGP